MIASAVTSFGVTQIGPNILAHVTLTKCVTPLLPSFFIHGMKITEINSDEEEV